MVRRLLDEHLALVLSTLAATTIVAKIWTVAHGGVSGMAALVSAGGLVSLLGALLAGIPAVGTVTVFAAGALLPEAIREGDDLRGPLAGTSVALLLGFALAPQRWFILGAVWLVGVTCLSLLLVVARAGWMRVNGGPLPFLLRKSEFPRGSNPLISVALVGVIAWAAVAASDRPWLPPEDIVTRTHGTITGYVLDDSDGLLLVRDSDRSVIRLISANVRARIVCNLDSRSQRSLLSAILWRTTASYPPCSGDSA